MKKILIVNDNNELQDILSISLGYGGYRVVQVASYQQVLTSAERAKPNVVILNAMMSSVDSFELCREIKNTSVLSDSFVMILNEVAKSSDRAKFLEIGADYYMTMPFDQAELITMLSGAHARSKL